MMRYIYMNAIDLEDGYYVEIIYDMKSRCYEAWLFNESVGVKELVFGIPVYQIANGMTSVETYESFVSLVLDTIDEYIETYNKDPDLTYCEDCQNHRRRTGMCDIWMKGTPPKGFCHRSIPNKK